MRIDNPCNILFSYHDNQDEILSLSDGKFGEDDFREKAFEVHKETTAIVLKFTNNVIFERPTVRKYYKEFEVLLMPFLEKLKAYYNFKNMVFDRLMLANIPPKSKVYPHFDGERFHSKTHRVHWVLKTNDKVTFSIGEDKFNFSDGDVFELDNCGRIHGVDNDGDSSRIHLIIDVREFDPRRNW